MYFNFTFSDEEGENLKPLKFKTYDCNTKIVDGKLQKFTNVSTCACS